MRMDLAPLKPIFGPGRPDLRSAERVPAPPGIFTVNALKDIGKLPRNKRYFGPASNGLAPIVLILTRFLCGLPQTRSSELISR